MLQRVIQMNCFCSSALQMHLFRSFVLPLWPTYWNPPILSCSQSSLYSSSWASTSTHLHSNTCAHTHTKKTCFLRKYFEQHLILMLVILLITFSFYKETQWPSKLDEKHMNTFTVSMSSKEKILILSSCHTFIYKEKWNGFNIIVWIWQIRNFAHVLYSCLLISEHVSSWVSEFSNTSYPTKTS